MTLSIVVNLGILAYFKYAVFVLGTTANVLNWIGVAFDPPLLKVILPLGISFYTFEAISYVVDVYRCKIKAIRQPLDYAIYILFFPHLVAGPIVPYRVISCRSCSGSSTSAGRACCWG